MISKKLVSLIIPVYNEEENINYCYEGLNLALQPLNATYDFEFIFTDNHSTDTTFEKLKKLAYKDPRVRAFRLSRNFGYQKSILTGYRLARGDAAIQVDCDLQDPPQLIPDLLKKWTDGYKVVYGVRTDRKENFVLKRVRKLFYRIIDLLSDTRLPHDAGDFRLVDRVILDELKHLKDADPYLRGTIAELGFGQIGIPYQREARRFGASKFPFSALIRLAIDGITNHSIVPLRLATYTGLAISIITLLGMLGYIAARFVFGKEWPSGFATTTALLLISLSLNSLFLGIIGEYLGRIYLQVKKRPETIIEEAFSPIQILPTLKSD